MTALHPAGPRAGVLLQEVEKVVRGVTPGDMTTPAVRETGGVAKDEETRGGQEVEATGVRVRTAAGEAVVGIWTDASRGLKVLRLWARPEVRPVRHRPRNGELHGAPARRGNCERLWLRPEMGTTRGPSAPPTPHRLDESTEES